MHSVYQEKLLPTKMDTSTQASHGRHTTGPIKPHRSEVTDVMRKSLQVKGKFSVPENILQDLSLLINDEWLDVGKYLNIPKESLPKIQTNYGARQKEATYKMLLGWKHEMGQQATYSILAEALQKAGRNDLAELSTELIEASKLSTEISFKQHRELQDIEASKLSTEISFKQHRELQDRGYYQLWRMERELEMEIEIHDERHFLLMNNLERQLDERQLSMEQYSKIRNLQEIKQIQKEQRYQLQKELRRELVDVTQQLELRGTITSFLTAVANFFGFRDTEADRLRRRREKLDTQLKEIKQKQNEQYQLQRKIEVLQMKMHDVTHQLELRGIKQKKNEQYQLQREIEVLQMELDDVTHQLELRERTITSLQTAVANFFGYRETETDGLRRRKEELQKQVKELEDRQLLLTKQVDLLWELHGRREEDVLDYEIEELQREINEIPKYQLLMKEQSKRQWESHEKIGHFIRCLKAKYISWLRSMNDIPWMKSGAFNVEDLFVDIGLQLCNSSQSWQAGWQQLDTFQTLFTHPDLQHAHFINVEGESGSGKTVILVRLVRSWCKSEKFTENIKIVIFLPCRFIEEQLSKEALYKTIKRKLLPRGTFLTANDVKDILTCEKSVLILDDLSSEVINGILGNDSDDKLHSLSMSPLVSHQGVRDIRHLILLGKLQLIYSLPNTPDTYSFGIHQFNIMRVKLQKWCRKIRLSYLRQLLPNEEKKHEIILKRLGENRALDVICANPLCYVLFVHLLKDDLLCGKDVKIERLTQFFKYIVEYLKKDTETKQMEKVKKYEKMDYPIDIIKVDYDDFRGYRWGSDYCKEVKDYHMLVDVGILVVDQHDSFNQPLGTVYKIFDRFFAASDNTSKSVKFCHKMFEVWFEALYLSKDTDFSEEAVRPLSPKFRFLRNVPLPNTDTAILQRFICGLNSELSVRLLENIARNSYDNDEHFFLCLHEYCGTDHSLRAVVDATCLRKREFKLDDSNQLVLRSMARLFNLASQWKIAIECIDIRDHDVTDVNGDGLTLSNGVQLGPLSAKVIKINKWHDKRLANFLSKCVLLDETRILANDSRGRRHEIQNEVEGMRFKVRWESNYKHESKGQKTKEEEEIVNLADLFANLDIRSDVSPVLSEVLRKEIIVDDKGGKLVIEKAAILLDIPPGALKKETKISIAVVNDAELKLPGDDIPMVTPLVKCEPCGQNFQKPVTLVLPHCGMISDTNKHKAISVQGFFSGETFQWQIDRDLQTSLSETKCSLQLTHFSIHGASIENLESKIMRAFLLKNKTEKKLMVKFWICNDDDSVFKSIENDENSNRFQKMGAFQNFTIYKTFGNVEAGCEGREKKEIHFNDIWRGSRGYTLFGIPFETGELMETLVAKQKENDNQSCRKEFVIHLEPLQKWPTLRHPHCEDTSNEPSIRVNSIAGCSMSSSETVYRHQSNHHVQEVCEDIVTENSLMNLSGLILTAEWKELGRVLGLSEAQLQHINNDHIGNTKEMIYQMLLSWKGANGEIATYCHLFETLIQVGRKDLVEVRNWVYTQATDTRRLKSSIASGGATIQSRGGRPPYQLKWITGALFSFFTKLNLCFYLLAIAVCFVIKFIGYD